MKIRKGFVSNSSSSAFICRTEHTIEEIKKTLQDILNFYNKLMERDLPYSDVFQDPRELTDADVSFLREYDYNVRLGNKNNIILESIGDNTVPYAIWELIIEKFDATRYHLG